MAAGRHGGYRVHEFRDLEADFGIIRKEIAYSTGEYDWIRKGDEDYERVQGRGRDSRVRQKVIKEREVMNGAPRRCGFAVRPIDREPGELSSDESDGAIDSETQDNKGFEVKMLGNGIQFSHLQNKKRKFSPVAWDRDDRETSQTVQIRDTLETHCLPPPPPPSAESYQESPKSKCIPNANVQTLLADDSDVDISEASPSTIDLLSDLSESPAETSSLLPQEGLWVNNRGIGVIDVDDDHLPPRTILSSRWANNAYSPAGEGEISDYEDEQKLKRKTGSESASRKSVSPEFGEVRKDGSEESRRRSSGADERVRLSSTDSYHDSDEKSSYMDIDDDQIYDGINVTHSDAESEDDSGVGGTPKPAHPPQRSVNMLQGCRSVYEFEKLNKIDEGTYGVVFRARDKKTGEIVALKKVKMEKEREGFPITSLREINILLSFHHPSIVNVKEVVMDIENDNIFMVMEYMEHDLKGLMETMKQPFSQSEVKCLMLQLLGGVKYLHDNWVLHRDLKTSNLLLNNRGELKICDFGLARQYGSPLKPYTPLVVTLWYRPPELLLGAKQYSTAIDMWSLGCIMAELLTKEPLFSGKSEVDQLDKIFKILGTPNETIWPGLSRHPGAKVNFVKHKYNLLRKKFPATSFTGSPVLSNAGFDLLSKLLTYDPDKRITAEEAIRHEWFHETPLPKSKEFMPTFPAQHAQDRRMR